MVGGDGEDEAADSVKDLEGGCIFVEVVSRIPYRDVSAPGEIGEPRRLPVGFERAVDVVWVFENSIKNADVEILIASPLHNLGTIGSAVQNGIEQRKARNT